MKLPEKFKGNPDFLTDEQAKINAIIDYLEQYEQQKPCNEICTNGKDTYHEWNMRESGKCFCKDK